MKHSIDFDNSCFYVDATDLIVDDYVHEMVHNNPFMQPLNYPQEEKTLSLLHKDEIRIQIGKKQWRAVTQVKGKIEPLLKEVTHKSIHMIDKFPIFSIFGVDHYYGDTNIKVGEYSFLGPP